MAQLAPLKSPGKLFSYSELAAKLSTVLGLDSAAAIGAAEQVWDEFLTAVSQLMKSLLANLEDYKTHIKLYTTQCKKTKRVAGTMAEKEDMKKHEAELVRLQNRVCA